MSLYRVWTLVVSQLLLATAMVRADYPQNPLLINDSVYVSQQGVYRFDRNQSEPLWSSLSGIQTFAPVVFENRLLVGSTRGLYALDLESGAIVWQIEEKRTLFTPSISTQAYAGSVHGELYAIDPRDGAIDWRRQFNGWIYSPAISEGPGLLWSGGQAHEIYAVNIDDGALRRQLATTQEAVFSPVELDAGEIAFNLFDGSTWLLGSTGTDDIEKLPGDSQPNSVHAFRDTIYRSHRDGTLSAFGRLDGKPRWRRSLTPQDLVMHPAEPGYLLLSDNDQTLLLLDLGQTDTLCAVEVDGHWVLPLQLEDRKILYFQRTVQPPGLTLVQTEANCK